MTSEKIGPKRIFFIAAGILLAGVALYLLVAGVRTLGRASRNNAAVTAAADDSPTPPGPSPATESAEETPEWADFSPDAASGEEAALERPIVKAWPATADVPSPFDRAHARARLAGLELRLEGVAPGAEPLALISGQVMRIGEAIDDFRVVRIERSGVTLIGPAGVRIDLAPGAATSGGAEPAAPASAPAAAVWRGEQGDRIPTLRPPQRAAPFTSGDDRRREALRSMPWARAERGEPPPPRRPPPPEKPR